MTLESSIPYLQELGAQKGDIMAILMPNNVEYPLAMFGASGRQFNRHFGLWTIFWAHFWVIFTVGVSQTVYR